MKYPSTLETTSYADVKDLAYEVAVLPIGATEPHGMHLPYGVDSHTATQIADRACRLANGGGARTLRLPTIPYGVDTNQMAFPFAMNVHQSTLNILFADLLDSLEHHGVRKVVVVNGHGGNEFKAFLREEYGKREQFACLIDWWRVGMDAYDEFFERPDDHSGEMETSVSLHLFPERVDLDRAGDGATRETDFAAINDGWVQVTRPWHLLTQDSSAGDPRRATAEKGARYVELVLERIAGFLIELSGTPYSPDMPYSKQLSGE